MDNPSFSGTNHAKRTGFFMTNDLFSDAQAAVSDHYDPNADAVFLKGDSAETLRSVPDGSVKLIITSPPYNLNKAYEDAKSLAEYFEQIEPVIQQLMRVLSPDGSLCWQVGNYVDKGEVFPLDMYYYPYFKDHGLKLRNRVIWHFDHGLHAKNRLSGRYETLLWFTKSDNYTFNLDPIRVPSKYPGKRNYKPGENYGKPSGNPLGKNPSDIWKIVERDWEHLLWDIPNVKANHPEKTIHPCQFPIELVERCVLAFTNEGDWVLDPFSGVGSAMLAALKQGRKAIGCEKEDEYITLAKNRVNQFNAGALPYRQLGKPVHKPSGREKVSQRPPEWDAQ
ncbi:TPA: site-specific DNA-methyltransferase [Pseudomonas aeruginosa]|nr:site-specific DNA-methyltransferase [Pseudomonas aeruginosa]HCF2497471.1 site-specific DNA-methyltransferase [Pseudomonas aeruginosa]HCF2905444.1 site-specific DNA-methyltransferase [Pseudomonas aeruginosa]